jgi:hypothetical protein
MRGKTARAFMLLIVFFGATGRAHSEGRIALLIGNEEYSPTIGALSNPRNDVARLGAALRKIVITQVSHSSMVCSARTHASLVQLDKAPSASSTTQGTGRLTKTMASIT